MRTTRANFASAFTLLELILVLALIAMMSGLAVPFVANFERGQRAGDTADQIVAMSRWAQAQSIARGVSFRLNFDSGQGQYWLTMQNGASYENVLQDTQSAIGSSSSTPTQTQFAQPKEEMGMMFKAPTGVRLDCSKLPQQPGGQYVEFHSTGRSDPAVVRIVDDKGKAIEVGCLSSTESYHVLSADELNLEQSLQQPPPAAQAR